MRAWIPDPLAPIRPYWALNRGGCEQRMEGPWVWALPPACSLVMPTQFLCSGHPRCSQPFWAHVIFPSWVACLCCSDDDLSGIKMGPVSPNLMRGVSQNFISGNEASGPSTWRVESPPPGPLRGDVWSCPLAPSQLGLEQTGP